MADLRAVLTETLREALGRLWTEPEDDADKPDWDQLPGKLADALLGLSGVAVTQLPEPATLTPTYEDDVTHAWEWDDECFLALDGEGIAGGTHLLDSRHVEDLLPLAAAILAAAGVFSEGATND